MTVSFPYPTEFLTDILDVNTSTFSLRRFDEESGSGDGRIWATELATPLWQAEVSLNNVHWDEARRINARIRALAGAKGTFLWADPSFQPEFDPGAGVTITGISSDRTAINVSGLPPLYGIRAGDTFSAQYAGGGRYFLGEFSEDVMANASGVAVSLSIMPYLPLSIAVGQAIEMRSPVVKMMVEKDGFTPYSFTAAQRASGASIRMVQKV